MPGFFRVVLLIFMYGMVGSLISGFGFHFFNTFQRRLTGNNADRDDRLLACALTGIFWPLGVCVISAWLVISFTARAEDHADDRKLKKERKRVAKDPHYAEIVYLEKDEKIKELESAKAEAEKELRSLKSRSYYT